MTNFEYGQPVMKSMHVTDREKRFSPRDGLTGQQVPSYLSGHAAIAQSGAKKNKNFATREATQGEKLVVAFVKRAEREPVYTLVIRDVQI